MSDIFREVDEAMQQEKMVKLWKEYSSTIILAIIILLVSSASTSFYYKWKADRNATETAKLSTALQSDNPTEAILIAAKDTKASHKAIGLLTVANIKLQDGKTDEAAALYKQIVDDKKAPRNLRDLARIFHIQNVKEPNAEILAPLLKNDKSPWVWHARLEAAVLSAHTTQDYAQALSYLADFKDAQYVAFSLKQRAEALSHVYKIKQAKATPAPVAADKGGE